MLPPTSTNKPPINTNKIPTTHYHQEKSTATHNNSLIQTAIWKNLASSHYHPLSPEIPTTNHYHQKTPQQPPTTIKKKKKSHNDPLPPRVIPRWSTITHYYQQTIHNNPLSSRKVIQRPITTHYYSTKT